VSRLVTNVTFDSLEIGMWYEVVERLCVFVGAVLGREMLGVFGIFLMCSGLHFPAPS
jgi:hypothetical protein